MSSRSTPLKGARTTWILTGATLASLAVLVLYGLVISPPDVVQGDAARLLYLHVPAAWTAYLAFFVTTIASILYLVPKTRNLVWDRVAGVGCDAPEGHAVGGVPGAAGGRRCDVGAVRVLPGVEHRAVVVDEVVAVDVVDEAVAVVVHALGAGGL